MGCGFRRIPVTLGVTRREGNKDETSIVWSGPTRTEPFRFPSLSADVQHAPYSQ